MKFALFFCIYIVGAVVTYGAANATRQWDCHNRWPGQCTPRTVREDQALAVFAAIFPPGWIAVALMTGGYQDGISFSATQHVVK